MLDIKVAAITSKIELLIWIVNTKKSILVVLA